MLSSSKECEDDEEFDLRKDSMLAAAEEEVERLKAEVERAKEQSVKDHAIHKQMQISLEAELNAAHVLVDDLEATLLEAQSSQQTLLESHKKVVEELQLVQEMRRGELDELSQLRANAAIVPVVKSLPEDIAKITVLTKQIESMDGERRKLETEVKLQQQAAREMKSRLASSEHQKRRLSESFGHRHRGSPQSREDATTKETSSQSLPSSSSSSSVAQMLSAGAEETCKRQKRRIVELEARLESKKHKLEKLREEYTALKEENEILQEESRYRTEKTRRCEAEIEQLNRQISELMEAHQHHQQERSQGEEEERNKITRTIDSLSVEASKWKQEFEEVQHKYERQIQLSEELQQLLETRDAELQSVRMALENLKLRAEDADYHLARAQELQQQVEELSQERDDIESRMEAALTEATKLREGHAFLSSESERLSKQVTILQREVQKLTDENGRLGGHANLKQKIHHHARVKEENTQLRKELGVLSLLAKKAESAATRTEEFIEQLQAAFKHVDSQLAAFSTSSDDKENNVAITKNNSNIQTSIKELRAFIKAKEKESAVITSAIQTLRAPSTFKSTVPSTPAIH